MPVILNYKNNNAVLNIYHQKLWLRHFSGFSFSSCGWILICRTPWRPRTVASFSAFKRFTSGPVKASAATWGEAQEDLSRLSGPLENCNPPTDPPAAHGKGEPETGGWASCGPLEKHSHTATFVMMIKKSFDLCLFCFEIVVVKNQPTLEWMVYHVKIFLSPFYSLTTVIVFLSLLSTLSCHMLSSRFLGNYLLPHTLARAQTTNKGDDYVHACLKTNKLKINVR